MNAPIRPATDRVTITIPKGLEDRWESTVCLVAERLGCSVEEARTLATATIVGRGIEHLEKMGR